MEVGLQQFQMLRDLLSFLCSGSSLLRNAAVFLMLHSSQSERASICFHCSGEINNYYSQYRNYHTFDHTLEIVYP